MSSPALHRFAILLAVGCFALVAAGAISRGLSPESHRLMGSLLILLSILQAVWAMRTIRQISVTITGWLLAGVLALSAWTQPAVVHSCLTQASVGVAMLFAAMVSPGRLRGPRPVADEGTPSARTLGWLTPVLVAVQVVLGAGSRHELMPLWPHLTGSLLVGALLLFAGMAVLQSYSFHDSLRPASVGLLWATGLQVTLGMTAYGVRMLKEPAAWTAYLTAGHIAVGAVTLGASLVFGLVIFYHVRETLLVSEAAA